MVVLPQADQTRVIYHRLPAYFGQLFAPLILIISNEYKNGTEMKRIHNNNLESFWCHRAKIVKVIKIVIYISQRLR